MSHPPKTLFVRNDDAGPLSDELRSFAELFLARAIPVSYQIIPALLTEECSQYLLSLAKMHPKLIEFGQHGLRHEMMSRGKRLTREFGPDRPYDDQLSDIIAGMKLLQDHLGPEKKIQIFTPPRHKFDKSTIKAAAAAGHRIWSAAKYPSIRHRAAYALGRKFGLTSFGHQGISYHGNLRPEADLLELSIGVAVDDGREPRISPSQIAGSIERAGRHTDTIGLMFHHAVYNSAEKREHLRAVVDRLTEVGKGRFRRMGELRA